MNKLRLKNKKENGKKYVFGFEESYGCLIGDYARDKDGVSAVMSLCEAAAYYKSKREVNIELENLNISGNQNLYKSIL